MDISSRTGMLAAALVLLGVMVFGADGAAAATVCGADSDVCVVVNTNKDVDQRDDVVSLREALLIQSGTMSPADLSSAEQAQVHVATNLGFSGSVDINFDATVFCEGCNGGRIVLQPPGIGEPDSYTGNLTLALPPGIGEPDGSPPGVGHRSLIGMGVVDGVEVPVDVVIDGSKLSDDYVGIWLTGKGSVQGIRFQNFAGHAIEIDGKYESKILIGSDGDGVLDSSEAVTFANNGADVVVLPAK